MGQMDNMVNWAKKDLKGIMQNLKLKPNSRLGQTFLIDTDVIQDQIDFAELSDKDTVLEIGPGLGVLTNKLAELAGKVIAVEFDKKLYSYLKTNVKNNVEVILGDAIKIDLPRFNKIVSNIPYQISSPLIFKLIEYQFELGIIMFQSEFAQRLIGKPNTKDYSRLTVMASYYYDIEPMRNVPKTSFYPVPKVDSVIMKLCPKAAKETPMNEPIFFQLVKIIFNERRKIIKNSILNQYSEIDHFLRTTKLKGIKINRKITKNTLQEIVAKLSNMDCRPEQLALEQLIQLSNEFYSTIENLS